eukprot:gene15161-biopygen6651
MPARHEMPGIYARGSRTGRNGCGRVPDASRTIEIEEADASRAVSPSSIGSSVQPQQRRLRQQQLQQQRQQQAAAAAAVVDSSTARQRQYHGTGIGSGGSKWLGGCGGYAPLRCRRCFEVRAAARNPSPSGLPESGLPESPGARSRWSAGARCGSVHNPARLWNYRSPDPSKDVLGLPHHEHRLAIPGEFRTWQVPRHRPSHAPAARGPRRAANRLSTAPRTRARSAAVVVVVDPPLRCAIRSLRSLASTAAGWTGTTAGCTRCCRTWDVHGTGVIGAASALHAAQSHIFHHDTAELAAQRHILPDLHAGSCLYCPCSVQKHVFVFARPDALAAQQQEMPNAWH